jgi:AmpD protein
MSLRLDPAGYIAGVTRIASPNCDARPAGASVSMLVIHNISLPPGEFGGAGIIDLFTNTLDAAAHPYYREIAGLRVSAHFLIRRDGHLIQFVSTEQRAWHAGESAWRGRSRCNDFSIGIELEGTDDRAFDDAQYATRADLVAALRGRYAVTDIVGHSDIAPSRKTDPGAGFDWQRLPRIG